MARKTVFDLSYQERYKKAMNELSGGVGINPDSTDYASRYKAAMEETFVDAADLYPKEQATAPTVGLNGELLNPELAAKKNNPRGAGAALAGSAAAGIVNTVRTTGSTIEKQVASQLGQHGKGITDAVTGAANKALAGTLGKASEYANYQKENGWLKLFGKAVGDTALGSVKKLTGADVSVKDGRVTAKADLNSIKGTAGTVIRGISNSLSTRDTEINKALKPVEDKLTDWADVENEGWLVRIGSGAVRSMPQSLLTAVVPAVGAPMIFNNAFQNIAEQYKAEGLDIEDKTVRMRAIGSAAVETASEYIFGMFSGVKTGAKAALKAASNGGIKGALIQGSKGFLDDFLERGIKTTLKPTVANYAKELAMKSAEEGFEEVVSSIGQGFIALATTEKGRKWLTAKQTFDPVTGEDTSGAIVLTELRDSFFSGAMAAGVMVGTSQFRQFKSTRDFLKKKLGTKDLSDISEEDINNLINHVRTDVIDNPEAAQAAEDIQGSMFKEAIIEEFNGKIFEHGESGDVLRATMDPETEVITLKSDVDGTVVQMSLDEFDQHLESGEFNEFGANDVQPTGAPADVAGVAAPGMQTGNLTSEAPEAPTASQGPLPGVPIQSEQGMSFATESGQVYPIEQSEDVVFSGKVKNTFSTTVQNSAGASYSAQAFVNPDNNKVVVSLNPPGGQPSSFEFRPDEFLAASNKARFLNDASDGKLAQSFKGFNDPGAYNAAVAVTTAAVESGREANVAATTDTETAEKVQEVKKAAEEKKKDIKKMPQAEPETAEKKSKTAGMQSSAEERAAKQGDSTEWVDGGMTTKELEAHKRTLAQREKAQADITEQTTGKNSRDVPQTMIDKIRREREIVRRIQEKYMSKEDMAALRAEDANADMQGRIGWLNPLREKDLSKKQKAMADVIESSTGKRIVFVTAVGSNEVNEFVSDFSKHTVFVNVKARKEKDIAWAIGHGLYHLMVKDRKDKTFTDTIMKLLPKGVQEAYLKQFSYSPEYQRYLADSGAITEEIIADYSGDVFTNPKTWESLAKNTPANKRAGIIKTITDFLTKTKTDVVDATVEVDAMLASIEEYGKEVVTDFKDALVAPVKTEQDAARAPPVATISTGTTGGTTGNTGELNYTPEQSIMFEYQVMPITDLIVSHDIDGNLNPAFDQTLQNRDRSRLASRAKTMDRAAKLNPKLMADSPTAQTGAPVIGPDRMVEVGNGRVLALREAMASFPARAKEYHDFLVANAEKLGLDKDSIPQNGILVRARTSEVDRQDFIRAANGSDTEALSASEKATSYASALTPDIMRLLDVGFDGNVNTGNNIAFNVAFVRKVVPQAEQSVFMTADGALTVEGITLIKNALFAYAYKNDALIQRMSESLDNDITKITGAMMAIAPRLVMVKNKIANQDVYPLDFAPDIVEAVTEFLAIKNRVARGELKSIEEYFNQMSLLTAISPEASDILGFIFENRYKLANIRSLFTQVIDIVEHAGSPVQSSLFDMPGQKAPTKLEVFAAGMKEFVAFNKEAGRNVEETLLGRGQISFDGFGEASGIEQESRGAKEETAAETRQETQQTLAFTAAETTQETPEEITLESVAEALAQPENEKPAETSTSGIPTVDQTSTRPKPKAKPKAQTETTEIADFGEKIGGAKKDQWRERGLMTTDLDVMNDAEAGKHVKKDNVWPKVDYAALRDSGVPGDVVYFVKMVRDSLPASPVMRYTDKTPELVRARREQYIDFVREVRDALLDVKTKADALGFWKSFFVGHGYFGYVKSTYSATEKGEWTEKGKDNAQISSKLVSSSQQTDRRWNYDVVRKMQEAQFLVSSEEKLPKGVEIKFNDGKRTWSKNDDWVADTYYVIKGHAILGTNFATEASAREWIKANLSDDKPGGKKRLTIPQLEGVHRTGRDYRENNTINSTGDDYLSAFHFKGGEFGNWVNQEERRVSLNYGYDALMDLADAMDVAPEDISLGGRLSIAFGSRGQGSAMAHFESDREVINLTKMKGAGSLAHEWGHALDFIVGKRLGWSSLLEDSRKIAMPEVRKIIDDMKNKPMDQEKSAAVYQKDLDRRQSQIQAEIDRLFNYYAPKMTPDQKTRLEQITRVMKSGKGEVPLGDSDQGIVGELNALHKAVAGRVIPKEPRDHLAFRIVGLNNATAQEVVPTAMQKTVFYTNAILLDRNYSKDTGAGYWQSEVEMFARAFACYITDKLKAMDTKSDYLSGHSDSAVGWNLNPTTGELEPVKGFPEGDERIRLNEDFDSLIAALKAKDILHDKGPRATGYNVVQYSMRREPDAEIFVGLKNPEIVTKLTTNVTFTATMNAEYAELKSESRQKARERIVDLNPGDKLGHSASFEAEDKYVNKISPSRKSDPIGKQWDDRIIKQIAIYSALSKSLARDIVIDTKLGIATDEKTRIVEQQIGMLNSRINAIVKDYLDFQPESSTDGNGTLYSMRKGDSPEEFGGEVAGHPAFESPLASWLIEHIDDKTTPVQWVKKFTSAPFPSNHEFEFLGIRDWIMDHNESLTGRQIMSYYQDHSRMMTEVEEREETGEYEEDEDNDDGLGLAPGFREPVENTSDYRFASYSPGYEFPRISGPSSTYFQDYRMKAIVMSEEAVPLPFSNEDMESHNNEDSVLMFTRMEDVHDIFEPINGVDRQSAVYGIEIQSDAHSEAQKPGGTGYTLIDRKGSAKLTPADVVKVNALRAKAKREADKSEELWNVAMERAGKVIKTAKYDFDIELSMEMADENVAGALAEKANSAYRTLRNMLIEASDPTTWLKPDFAPWTMLNAMDFQESIIHSVVMETLGSKKKIPLLDDYNALLLDYMQFDDTVKLMQAAKAKAYDYAKDADAIEKNPFVRNPARPDDPIEKTPDLPYKKDYMLMGFKLWLRDAVKRGHDYILWSGWTHAKRWGTRGNYAKLKVLKTYESPETGKAYEIEYDGSTLEGTWRGMYQFGRTYGFREDQLDETFGKSMAAKIRKAEIGELLFGQEAGVHNAFVPKIYDDYLPAQVNKYIKQWGAKAEYKEVAGLPGAHWVVEINPAMREAVLNAPQTLYSMKKDEDVPDIGRHRFGMRLNESNLAKPTLDLINDAAKFYDIQHHKETYENAAHMVRVNPSKTRTEAADITKISPELTVARMLFMYMDQMRGNHAGAAQWAYTINKAAKTAGQAVEAHKMFDKLEPAGVLHFAIQQIQRYIGDKDLKALEDKTSDVTNAIHDAELAALRMKLADLEEINRALKKETTSLKAKLTAAKNLEERIKQYMRELGEFDHDPIKDFVDILHGVVTTIVPFNEQPKTQDPIAFVRWFLKNSGNMGEAWESALAMFKRLYADDDLGWAEVMAYFGELMPNATPASEHKDYDPKTLKQIGTAFEAEYSSDFWTFQSMVKRLLELDVDERDAVLLARHFQKAIGDLSREEKIKTLRKILPRPTEPGTRHMIDKIVNLSNEHGLTSAEVQAYIAHLMGLPSLTPELVRELTDLAAQMAAINEIAAKQGRPLSEAEQRQVDVLSAMILARIANQRPVHWSEKVDLVQSMMMLSMFKSGIRNILGNTVFLFTDTVKDFMSAILDRGLAQFTGTKTIPFPDFMAMWQGAKRGAIQSAFDISHDIDTSVLDTGYSLPRGDVLRSKAGKIAMRVFRYKMTLPDRVAQGAAYESHLRGLMRMNGVSEPTTEMIEAAQEFAAYKTFTDDNPMSNLFGGLRSLMNGNFLKKYRNNPDRQIRWGLGSILIKFPRVPGALLMRTLEYSPLSLGAAVITLIKPMLEMRRFGGTYKDNFGKHQKKLALQLSNFIVGTPITIGLGILLTALGLMTGREPEDKKERDMLQSMGVRAYQINWSGLWRFIGSGFDAEAAVRQAGDNLSTYEWMAPLSLGMAIGSNLYQETKTLQGADIDDFEKFTQIAMVASFSGLESITEMSLMQGLAAFMSNDGYRSSIGSADREKPFFGEKVINAAVTVPASFIPNALKVTRELLDNTRRYTYDTDALAYAYNIMLNKLPGAEKTLPPSVDVFGNLKEIYQNNGNNVFNVFFNPSFSAKYTPTHEAMMVLNSMAIKEGTKYASTNVTPGSVSTSIDVTVDGEKRKLVLTPAERMEMQEIVGQNVRELFKQIPAGANEEAKIKAMNKILSEVSAAAKDYMARKKLGLG